MTFTPEAAGPIIPPFLGESISIGMGISPNMTPSRRRPNHSPSAHHPVMSGWKFPSTAATGGNSNTATPTRLTIDTQHLGPSQALRTPTRSRSRSHGQPQFQSQGQDQAHPRPQLLWPPQADTSHAQRQRRISPPDSGFRLGVLLGLGEPIQSGDTDMEVDDNSTAHGHGPASAFEYGFGHGNGQGQGQGYGSGSYPFAPYTEYQEDAIRFD
jgi:hypothetical protein